MYPNKKKFIQCFNLSTFKKAWKLLDLEDCHFNRITLILKSEKNIKNICLIHNAVIISINFSRVDKLHLILSRSHPRVES